MHARPAPAPDLERSETAQTAEGRNARGIAPRHRVPPGDASASSDAVLGATGVSTGVSGLGHAAWRCVTDNVHAAGAAMVGRKGP